jgi:hypothetical protein
MVRPNGSTIGGNRWSDEVNEEPLITCLAGFGAGRPTPSLAYNLGTFQGGYNPQAAGAGNQRAAGGAGGSARAGAAAALAGFGSFGRIIDEQPERLVPTTAIAMTRRMDPPLACGNPPHNGPYERKNRAATELGEIVAEGVVLGVDDYKYLRQVMRL